jgi:hypothetical protein
MRRKKLCLYQFGEHNEDERKISLMGWSIALLL